MKKSIQNMMAALVAAGFVVSGSVTFARGGGGGHASAPHSVMRQTPVHTSYVTTKANNTPNLVRTTLPTNSV